MIATAVRGCIAGVAELERRAHRDAQTHACLNLHHRVTVSIATPHLAPSAQDIPQLLHRTMRHRNRHRALATARSAPSSRHPGAAGCVPASRPGRPHRAPRAVVSSQIVASAPPAPSYPAARPQDTPHPRRRINQDESHSNRSRRAPALHRLGLRPSAAARKRPPKYNPPAPRSNPPTQTPETLKRLAEGQYLSRLSAPLADRHPRPALAQHDGTRPPHPPQRHDRVRARC